MHGRISKQKTVSVCLFPGGLTPRPFAEPCLSGVGIYPYPSAPSRSRHCTHVCGVCVCVLTYVGGGDEPRG